MLFSFLQYNIFSLAEGNFYSVSFNYNLLVNLANSLRCEYIL